MLVARRPVNHNVNVLRGSTQAEMDELAPQRDHWIAEFFDRIQRWGFNFNGDQRRKISKEELPAKPDRPFKVNF